MAGGFTFTLIALPFGSEFSHGLGAWLLPWLPLLRTPLGALAFVPLYALWVTLLLPGVWALILLFNTLAASPEMGGVEV